MADVFWIHEIKLSYDNQNEKNVRTYDSEVKHK